MRAFFSYINKYWISSTGERIIAEIRERVFAHLQRLSLSFHESMRTGNLIYLLTSDVKEMKALMIGLPQELANRVFSFFAYATLMMFLDWRLGLIALSTAPLLYFFTKWFGTGMKEAMAKKRIRESAVT